MIPAGGVDSVDLDLQIGATFQGTSLINNAEITSDGGDDVDSNPNDNSGDGPDPGDDLTDDGNGDGGNQDPSDDDFDPAVISVVQTYDLSLTKEIFTPGPYTPGQDIVYHITVCNEGSLDANFFEVSDHVPDGLSLSPLDVNRWTLAGGTTYTTTYTEGLPALNPDSCVVIPIVLTIDPNFSGGSIVNEAEITDDDGNDIDSDTDSTAGEDDEDVAILSLFDLALMKTINTDLTPSPLYLGSEVSYDITIYNQGSISAYDVQVEDYHDPLELIFLSLNLPSVSDQGSPVNIVADGSSFTVEELSAGDQVTVTLTFQIHPESTNPDIVNNAEIVFGSDSPGGELALDEDSPLDVINDGSTNELDTDNEISDNISGGLDASIDEDDYDPALISVLLCTPSVTSCPTNWVTSVNLSTVGCSAPALTVADIIGQTDIVIETCGEESSIGLSFDDELIPMACTDGFTERTVIRTYTFTNVQTGEVLSECPQEIVYEIESCQPLTSFGVIGVSGASLVNVPSGCNLPNITVIEEEQGACGFVEYMWLVSTEQDPNGNPIIPTNLNLGTVWQIIEGENDPTLNPGTIVQNTHYVRCVRNFSCCNFAESNIVTFVIDDTATCPIEAAAGVEELVDCDNIISLVSPTDDYLSAEQKRFITNLNAAISNKTGVNSNLTVDAKQGVEGLPGLEVYQGGALEVYLEGCKED